MSDDSLDFLAAMGESPDLVVHECKMLIGQEGKASRFCGRPATSRIRDTWFCEQHYQRMMGWLSVLRK